MFDSGRHRFFSSAVLARATGVWASFLCLLAAWIWPLIAFAEPSDAQQSGTMHVQTADGRLIRHVPCLDTQVRVDVSGLLARVRVQQRFVNPSAEWVEALYVFPLPDDSAVDHLRMRFAGRVIEGEIQARAEARRTYDAARQGGQRASLLEQQRPNMFTASVANLPPGEEIQVEIEYQQAVKITQGLFSLRFPMVVGPRYIPGNRLDSRSLVEHTEGFDGHGWAMATDQVPDAAHITPPVIAKGEAFDNPVELEILLDAGIDLLEVHSPYHKIDKDVLTHSRYRVTLADERVPADRDFVLQWRLAVDDLPKAALFSEQWRDRNYALLMVMPPPVEQLDVSQLPPRELTLVVDTSGSMHGDSIEQAKNALQFALGQLRPQDSFNLIEFNDRFRALHPRAVRADREHLQRALRHVRRLTADGGTEMEPAMRYVLSQQRHSRMLRQIVFLTDGDIGNEQALFATIQKHLGDARLFPVGIGSAPNSYFMTRASSFGRGSYTFIGDLQEVEAKMQGLFERLAAPVLTNIRVSWQRGDGQAVTECGGQAPHEPTDLYAGEPLSLMLCTEDTPRSVQIEGRLGPRAWRKELRLDGGASSAGVHVLWARQQIADWMARRTLDGDPDRARSAIVDLALEHHLVSAFTSLVAVDRTPVRPVEDALHTKPVPTHLPNGWSRAHVFVSLPQTATLSSTYLLSGAILVLLALAGLARRSA